MNLINNHATSHRLVLRERGMTLVEIIVVLIILGIVMAFVGGKVFGAGDKAKADLTKIKMKDVKMSIEQFRLRYNGLPASLDDLMRCSERTGPDCVPITGEDNLLDSWNNKFTYSLENGGRSYRIKSFGADGVDGGEGVNYDVSETGP